MKVSLNWLKNYVSWSISPQKLAHKLTMAGFEVQRQSKISGDTVFELEITPNRPDCLSMLGVAREVSAILNKPLKNPLGKKVMWPKKKCSIEIGDKKGCLRYIGILIDQVKIAQSPQWLKQYLSAIGLHSINNIVDITNFCLMETGQPLHAFDFDKLKGGRIIVRRAHKGEKIITIDDQEYALDPSILVIADQKKPVAIAGIMGGKNTEVTAETKNILLESAYFDPTLVRRAARKLGLSSDSSYRFERGVDYHMVEKGATRAVSLIIEYAKGKVSRRSDTMIGKKKTAQKNIVITLDQINTNLGSRLGVSQCTRILKKLGFHVTRGKKSTLKIQPPAFRSDVDEDVDIIEEIARVIGYDILPSALPQVQVSQIPLDGKRLQRERVKKRFLAQGFNEVITYSLINQESLQLSNLNNLSGITIQNPLTQEHGMMRPSLLPSLLSIVNINVNRGQKQLKLFEVGKIYSDQGEQETLGVIMVGSLAHDWRKSHDGRAAYDFFDIKGALEYGVNPLLSQLLVFDLSLVPFFEEGQGANISMGNKTIGMVGKIRKDVLDNFDVKVRDVYFCQIDLEYIYTKEQKDQMYSPVSIYPAVRRDSSLAVKKNITYRQIEEKIWALSPAYLKSVELVDGSYQGKDIALDRRALMISFNFQSLKTTLIEAEVNVTHQKIIKMLAHDLDITIR